MPFMDVMKSGWEMTSRASPLMTLTLAKELSKGQNDVSRGWHSKILHSWPLNIHYCVMIFFNLELVHLEKLNFRNFLNFHFGLLLTFSARNLRFWIEAKFAGIKCHTEGGEAGWIEQIKERAFNIYLMDFRSGFKNRRLKQTELVGICFSVVPIFM